MSELTRCNYCSFHSLEAAAEKNGMVVNLDTTFKTGGVFVNVGPPGVDMAVAENRLRYPSKAWYMEIGDHCTC